MVKSTFIETYMQILSTFQETKTLGKSKIVGI